MPKSVISEGSKITAIYHIYYKRDFCTYQDSNGTIHQLYGLVLLSPRRVDLLTIVVKIYAAVPLAQDVFNTINFLLTIPP